MSWCEEEQGGVEWKNKGLPVGYNLVFNLGSVNLNQLTANKQRNKHVLL